jgi:glycosyltransferase involved in cell wall biosynthesis
MNRCSNTMPLVSVAMGVYNAEKFLASSIQSILNQEYQNFELIISDNGSTDRSSDICRSFAKKDSRILYRRNETNINPMKNAKMLLDLSSGVYHHGAADHDLYHPRYLSCMVDILEREGDSLAMAYPDTRYIDMDGNRIKDIREDVDTRNLSAPERFKKTLWGLTYCTPMYGLFRSSALKKVWKMRSITGPDRVLLNELSLVGSYAHHQEELFSMRRNRPAENHMETKRRQSELFVGNDYESMVPSIMRDLAIMEVVADSGLGALEKEELLEEVLRYHHAEPCKYSKSEVEHLVRHALIQLTSDADNEQTKRLVADDCLRIVDISRMFRPELAPQLDQLKKICETVKKGDNRPKAQPPVSHAASDASPYAGSEISLKNPTASSQQRGMPSKKKPVVSIGMPIYNQEKFLEKTIESLLGQEFGDFELCIIDNASTDQSFDICQRYARADQRIRIVKNRFNLGRVAGFDLALKHCSGKYFMWSSGHDLYHRGCLRQLLDQFNANGQSAAMVVPGTALIDTQDHLIKRRFDHLPDTQSLPTVERFKRIIWNFRLGYLSGGLFRSALLKKVWDPFNIRGAMHVVAARLSLLGDVIRVNDTVFFKRMTTGRSDLDLKSADNPHLGSLTITKNEATIPYTILAYEHIDMVRRSAIEPPDKKFLYEEIKKCFTQRFNLNDEALAFLKRGVEMLGEKSRQSVCCMQTMTELTQLSNLCSFFQDHHQHVFDRFNQLILNMTPN